MPGKGNSECLIIGGGVIGLSIARELQARGVGSVTIVERAHIGGESSWAAAGMLAPNIETDTSDHFHRFGTESLAMYPGFADGLLDETGIDIELDRSGTLCLAFDDAEAEELGKVYRRQIARTVPVELLRSEDIRDLEPGISRSATHALLYPTDWQVENRRLVAALRHSIVARGAIVREHAEVTEVRTANGRVTAVISEGELNADIAVLATGAWTSLIKIAGIAAPPVRPIRGQMLSFAPGERQLRKVVYSRRGYLVPRADCRILVGATVEDVGFDKSTSEEGLDSLKTAAIEIIPALSEMPVADVWAGLRPYTNDALPVIGEIPGNAGVLIATAHYRNGILLAPRTAEIIADRIVDGKSSPYFDLYGVERFGAAANARRSY